MKINYKLTNSDFLAYQLYTSSRSNLHKNRRFKSRMIIPVLYILFGLYLSYINQDKAIGVIFLAIAVVWFIFYPYYYKWIHKKHIQKYVEENYKNRVNQPIEIYIEENFLFTKDFTSESRISGSEIKELIETNDHFFIKLTTNVSIIVPKYSVENQTEFKNKITKFEAKYVDELGWKWK